jgi:uncharacterized protein (TIGR02145 family)
LYKGDTTGLISFLEISKGFHLNFSANPIPDGKYVNIGNSEIEYNDYLKFLVSLSLGEKNNWKAFIDKTYNSSTFGQSWQSVISNQLSEIEASTSFIKTDISEAISYLKSKNDEIIQIKNDSYSDIKEFKLGNQIWMASDLNIIPSNLNYQLVINNKIQSIKVGKGIILYGLSDDNINLCPKGWRIPTTSDWETLIKSLGGDKEAAAELLMVGKGSGFEATFPIVVWREENGYNQPEGLVYSDNYPGVYLCYDTDKKKIYPFNFGRGYEYELTYHKDKVYVPCRCIKE